MKRTTNQRKNPLLKPVKGEPDLLPRYLRDGINELKEVLSVRDEAEYLQHRYECLLGMLERGDNLSEDQRKFIARYSLNKPKRKKHRKYSNVLIHELMRIIWHDPKRELKQEYRDAGYSLITETRPDEPPPPWLAPNKETAFMWIGEFLCLSDDYVDTCYYEPIDRYNSCVPWSIKNKALE